MTYPTQRVTINAADYNLLWPGLESLANGLANAKLGLFPRRNAWHGVDEQAADIYKDRAFDQAMANRIVAVRAKLMDITGSGRVRLDAFEIAVAALASRLRNANTADSSADTAEMASLGRRLETYRKRAKRATIARIGGEEYRFAAQRWGRMVAWCRFNLLNFAASAQNRPWRKDLWRSQREQLGQVIDNLLFSRYYESPTAKQMKRIVTLMASSSRRGRLHIGIRELIADPIRFSDLILSFISKRISLRRLPNAPAPAWQVVTDRTDQYHAYLKSRSQIVTATSERPPSRGPDAFHQSPASVTNEVPEDTFAAELFVSDVDLRKPLAAWFRKEVVRSFWIPVKEQAHYLIKNGLAEQYRRSFNAKTIRGLIEEFRPPSPPMLAEEPTNEYVGWLLGILLAVRSSPSTVYDGVSYSIAYAVQLEKEESHAR